MLQRNRALTINHPYKDFKCSRRSCFSEEDMPLVGPGLPKQDLKFPLRLWLTHFWARAFTNVNYNMTSVSFVFH